MKKEHTKEHKPKHKAEKKAKPKYFLYGIIAVIVVVAVVAALMLIGGNGPKSGNSTVELYVMSQCPYGVQAEDALLPVIKNLGNSVKLELAFIGSVNTDGTFRSLHGEPEVKGDMVQVCAMKYEPAKYMDFILCMNKDSGAIPGNWEACADSLKLDKAAIKKCYEGAEGKELLTASFKIAELAQAQGSPTIKINGKDYAGQRDAASFTRAVCKNLDSPACSNIPTCTQDADCMISNGKIPKCVNAGAKDAKCEYTDDAKVVMTVLNDKSCTDCDASQIVSSLQNAFLNMEVKTVDIASDEGKKLVAQFGVEVVPAFIFDKGIEQTFVWQNNAQVKTLFESKDGSYKIVDDATGASHYVSEEKRLELMKKIGVTLGDNKPQIDFFVMSYCPYGNQAEEIVDKVYAELGDKAIFNPRYVIYSNYGDASYCLDSAMKYCSMHGLQELNQDVREMCVNKYMGISKWFEFAKAMNAKCFAANADSCWEAVAKGLGLDTQKIKDCEKSEALALLEKDQELGNLLGVSGSPQIFIEGQEYSGARDANSILGAMCSAFDSTKPTGCGNTITGTAASTTAATGGCG